MAQSGTVDLSDVVNHGTSVKSGLVFIKIGTGGSFAFEVVPAAAISDAGIVSALASTSSSQLPAIPPWIVNSLAHLDLIHGPLANLFQHPAPEATPKAKAILVKADQVADALGLDALELQLKDE